MKSPRTLALSAAAVLVILLSACSTPTESVEPPAADDTSVLAEQSACEGDEGVTFVVDGSALPTQDVSATWCVFAEAPIAASDVLTAAGVETEGTDEYGDQVVCRVDGAPAADAPLIAEDGSEYFETCAAMPAAFAYWSLWVQPADADWGYAEEGLSTLQLEPGQSLGLLFTLNGEPATLEQ